MGDLLAGLGSEPEFWQQPTAAPKPTPEKQPPQPVNAVWDKLLGDNGSFQPTSANADLTEY